MKVMIAEEDAVLRDQISIGLSAFKDMEIHEATGLIALDKMRHGEYDFLVLGIGTGSDDSSHDLLERLRSEDLAIEILIIAPEAAIQQLREEKARGHIFGFLQKPLQPVEFFRTIARLFQRREPVSGRASNGA